VTILAFIIGLVGGASAAYFTGWNAGYRAGKRVCPPLNQYEAAMYDRFVEYLIQRGRIEEQAGRRT
jgi:hypothetical protein